MDGKLNKLWKIRISDDAHEAIKEMPFEQRKRMNRIIRTLIENEIANHLATTFPAPSLDDTSVQESV